MLLLQLALRLDHGVTPADREKILRVASILQQIGQSRPNAISVATLHAERILRLVGSLDSSDSASMGERLQQSAPTIVESNAPSFYSGLHPPVWPVVANPASAGAATQQHVAAPNSVEGASSAAPSDLAAAYSWLFPPSSDATASVSYSQPPSNSAPFSFLDAPSSADLFSLPLQSDFLDMTAHDPMMGWLWGGGGGGVGAGGSSGTEAMNTQLAALMGEVEQL